jgi:hypothetical protein
MRSEYLFDLDMPEYMEAMCKKPVAAKKTHQNQ